MSATLQVLDACTSHVWVRVFRLRESFSPWYDTRVHICMYMHMKHAWIHIYLSKRIRECRHKIQGCMYSDSVRKRECRGESEKREREEAGKRERACAKQREGGGGGVWLLPLEQIKKFICGNFGQPYGALFSVLNPPACTQIYTYKHVSLHNVCCGSIYIYKGPRSFLNTGIASAWVGKNFREALHKPWSRCMHQITS